MKTSATRIQRKPISGDGLRKADERAGRAARARREPPPRATMAPTESVSHGSPARGHVSGMDAISIRPVRASDISQVIALDQQVTGLAKTEYWQSLFQRYSRPAQVEQFFLVAVAAEGSAEAVLGFILGEVRAWEFGSAPCGWVFALSVRADTRLRGLGQALLDEIAAKFRSCGVTKMRTMVARGNQLLLQFFRAGGMVAGPYVELEKELG